MLRETQSLADLDFERLQKRFEAALKTDEGMLNRRRQELTFASIVRQANRLGFLDRIWAYGCISCSPEITALGTQYDRPHKDIDLLVVGASNLDALAKAANLSEIPSRLTQGSPLHLFTEPDNKTLVEMRCLEIPDVNATVYAYTRPLWTRVFMRKTLGMPRSALYKPTSIFEWGGVECQRVALEYTYITKICSPAAKDRYDAEVLRRSGSIDRNRIQMVQDEISQSGLNLMVPPVVASIFRWADRRFTAVHTRDALT